MSGKHTPTPWRVGYEVSGNTVRARTFITAVGDERFVADADRGCGDDAEDEANAALIVRCVNAHDALVSALRGARKALCVARYTKTLPLRDSIDAIDAALKLAEGK